MTEEELLPGAGSAVGELTVAVFRSSVPRLWVNRPVTVIVTAAAAGAGAEAPTCRARS